MGHSGGKQASRVWAAGERRAPEVVEIPLWHAVTLGGGEEVSKARPIFRRVFAREPIWADLVPKLVPSGLLPDDPDLIKRILAEAPPKAKNRR